MNTSRHTSSVARRLVAAAAGLLALGLSGAASAHHYAQDHDRDYSRFGAAHDDHGRRGHGHGHGYGHGHKHKHKHGYVEHHHYYHQPRVHYYHEPRVVERHVVVERPVVVERVVEVERPVEVARSNML